MKFIYIYIIYYISSLICDSAMLPENVDRSTRLNFINLYKYEKIFFFIAFYGWSLRKLK